MICSTGAEIIIHLLKEHGIKTVAGLPGATVLPIYDELLDANIKHILVRHEQAAGFVAQGMARSTELPAVCIATSGPGALNLLTAIADAKADSIPLIAITGQVSTNRIGTDAFQEADIFGLSMPITKHSMLIKSARELLTAIPKAFEIALEGRPGPVLLDIPIDVQNEVAFFCDWPKAIYQKRRVSHFDTKGAELWEKIDIFAKELQKATSPLLLIGGGCKSLMASSVINEFLEVCPIPVVSTLMGLGVVPSTYDKFCGMIGIYGGENANYALKNADLILAFGVRFDNRSIGKANELASNAKILQIDIDAAEINKLQESYCGIVGDVRAIVPELTSNLISVGTDLLSSVGSSVGTDLLSSVGTDLLSSVGTDLLNPTKQLDTEQKPLNQVPGDTLQKNGAELISQFAKNLQNKGILLENVIVVTDVGLHQMWVANGFPFSKSNQFLTSGSLGTMGFGLPAAIGAAIANPNKKIILFTGDSSILMNVQELATLKELSLNVTIVVLDNSTLGMVYQMQEKIYKNHFQTKYKQATNIAKVAESFGIQSRNIDYKAVFDYPDSFFDFAFAQAEPTLLRVEVPSTWK